MIEIKLNNRDGTEWDISELVTSLSLKTAHIGKAGTLTLTFIKKALYQSSRFKYENGDVIRVRKDGVNLFYGYIFSISGGRDEIVSLTAYDQIRYLMNTDTYVFKNTTAADIVKRIANDFNLKLGKIADTKYQIPAMVEDGQKLLDIIDKAITLTFSNTGKDYCLYDDFGQLCLRDVDEQVTDIIVGEGSLMYDYSVSSSIDDDTYNKIKLYKDNKETGKREVYIAEDSINIMRWGLLQHYESIDEKMNPAQIEELLNNLAKLKNREQKSLKIEAIGDIRVRAGMRVRIHIPEYQVNQNLLVNECSHSIEGADHTMSLELKVI
ncbi:XkdQ/YqbQ family protein [Paenibacillus sp. GXUN7292]|uniref:XkdQ/YqbQ family protein n=1 Tax=Paenibacillus sp. GXUN7292 TaxID=3422499 RepID=UPI003D7D94BF